MFNELGFFTKRFEEFVEMLYKPPNTIQKLSENAVIMYRFKEVDPLVRQFTENQGLILHEVNLERYRRKDETFLN